MKKVLVAILFLPTALFSQSPRFNVIALADSIRNVGYNVSRSLPRRYVTDGSVDYTSYVQSAVTGHSAIVFPGFPILISDVGIKFKSNQAVLFETGSQIKVKASAFKGYKILLIKNITNVTLVNPVIYGDRLIHTGSGGEQGHLISVLGSRNVRVYNANCQNAWGDGIYIGDGLPSVNILIESPYLENDRRNGISVTNAQDVWINNAISKNINGTLPEDGIDIEANRPSDILQNINIISAASYHNRGYGTEISLGHMYGAGINHTISVNVVNQFDSASRSAAYISCEPNLKVRGDNIKGIINWTNPVWKNFGRYAWRPYGNKGSVTLNLVNPLIYSGTGSTAGDTTATKAYLSREIYPGSKTYITFGAGTAR